MFDLVGAAIPIPAIVPIAFDLMQDGVYPRSDHVRFVLLHQLMGGIPLARRGEVDSLEEMLVQNR